MDDDSDPQRQLARERRRSKQRKDCSSLALIEFDMQGRIVGWNRQATAVYGWTEAEALGRSIALLLPEATRPHVDAIFAGIAAGTDQAGRYPNVRKDGRAITCQWYNAVLRGEDDAPELVYCEVRDVTDEEALRSRQQLMRALADRSPLGIFAKDAAGVYIYANDEFARSVGLAPHEVLGLDDYGLFDADIAADLIRHDAQVVAAGTTLRREDNGVGPDQDRYYWSLKFPLQAPDGALMAVCGIVNDISSLKHSERIRAALQQQVIESQQALLAELSTPLIPVAEGVLVMPVIGSVDSARAERIMETLLEGVTRLRARAVILDITGARELDARAADALLGVARAVRLLGAEAILTGIGPTIAELLVDLDIDLRGLVTFGSLRAGIAHAARLRRPAQR